VYAVIMAGGGGTRLWPLSSPECPKPFLPLLGERTLLQLSADRLVGLVEPTSIFVVTDRRHADLVAAQLPFAHVLSEPQGRNTAAAIALATVAIERRDDEVMLVLPADQTIERGDDFRTALSTAEAAAGGVLGVARPIVTLGIEPTYPAIVYGYIVPTDRATTIKVGAGPARLVRGVARFTEKPDRDAAEAMLNGPHRASWNGGIFAWRRATIRAAFERDAPEILTTVAEGVAGDLAAAYERVMATSIDYAVLEPASVAGDVLVVPADVGWSDLGSWTSLLAELGIPDIEATIARPGEAFEAADDDLVVWRSNAGRLTATHGADATMAESDGPVAVLRGARTFQPQIDALLDRCSTPEAHS
jgi:mannose-1-phosphate guanylyltransferase